MSFRRHLAKFIFCFALALSSLSGAPMDPKQIEELLQIMNDAKIEVVVPAKNSEPELPIIRSDLPPKD